MFRLFHRGTYLDAKSVALILFFFFILFFVAFGTVPARSNITQVLFVGENGIREKAGSFDFSAHNILHYNRFSLDITVVFDLEIADVSFLRAWLMSRA